MKSLTLAAWFAAFLIMIGVFAVAAPYRSDPGPFNRTAKVSRVIDGDTFVISTGERIRVRNFDTPELRSYDCPEEKIAAQGARRAARALLTRQTVRLSITGKDRYGRMVADVALLKPAGSRDFVDAMVSTGHGARWRYGKEPQPNWCPAGRRWG